MVWLKWIILETIDGVHHINVRKKMKIFTQICRKQTNDGSLSKPGCCRLPCHHFSNGRFRQTYIFFIGTMSHYGTHNCHALSNTQQCFFPLSRPILRLHISLNKCCWLSKSAQLPTVLNTFGNVFHKHIKMKKLYSSDTNMICNILKKPTILILV